MGETPEQLAEKLRVKAEHYADALALAASICERRSWLNSNQLADVFKEKARLERQLAEKLASDDAIPFLRREGLIYPY